MDLFLQVLVSGVTVGGTYALAAIGISLIFGILNIINFGHGAALTIGAFLAALSEKPSLWRQAAPSSLGG